MHFPDLLGWQYLWLIISTSWEMELSENQVLKLVRHLGSSQQIHHTDYSVSTEYLLWIRRRSRYWDTVVVKTDRVPNCSWKVRQGNAWGRWGSLACHMREHISIYIVVFRAFPQKCNHLAVPQFWSHAPLLQWVCLEDRRWPDKSQKLHTGLSGSWFPCPLPSPPFPSFLPSLSSIIWC